MARPKNPPPPPAPPSPPASTIPAYLYARRLAGDIRSAYGFGAADTLDSSEDLGEPRSFVSWGNVAFRRLVGSDMPLGRIVEVSGMEGAGKSTAADQLLAQVQLEPGGMGLLYDSEKSRSRKYMMSLGVDPAQLVFLSASSMEDMFDEVELLSVRVSDGSNRAWADALALAGKKIALPTKTFRAYDPSTAGQRNRKPSAQWPIALWDNAARGVLAEWQAEHGLAPSGIRDAASRAVLRPVIVETHGDDGQAFDAATLAEARAAWAAGVPHPLCRPADAPIVFVWDSVALTGTDAEMEGSNHDSNPAAAARVLRAALRRLIRCIDDQAIGMFFVNQRYEVIQIGWSPNPRPAGGDNTQSYGGSGLRFAATVRIKLERGVDIYAPGQPKDQGYSPIGVEVKAHLLKSRLGAPGKVETYGLIYGRGAVDAWTIYSDLKERNIIACSGPWSKFSDPTILPSVGAENKSWSGSWVQLEEMFASVPGLYAKLVSIYLEGA